MKALPPQLSRYIWVFFAPFSWLIGLAMTHELCASNGLLRAPLEALVRLTSSEPSTELVGLAGLTIGGGLMWLLIYLTHKQNQPERQRATLKERPEWSEAAASLCLLIGAVILGSELDNALTHMSGVTSQPVSAPDPAELGRWREALMSPWGLGYELILLPLAECYIFHQVVQRGVPIQSERLRVAFVTLVMTTFSWRLSASPLLVNLCAAWLFERVRSPSLSLSFYFDFQLIGWLIALGYGPQVPGFDLLGASWQPWGFNLIGVAAIFAGVTLLERTPPFIDKRAAQLWDELMRGELNSAKRSAQQTAEDEKDRSDEEER